MRFSKVEDTPIRNAVYARDTVAIAKLLRSEPKLRTEDASCLVAFTMVFEGDTSEILSLLRRRNDLGVQSVD